MATRSTITVKCNDGKYRAIYCHFDGYLDGVGADLLQHYNNQEAAERLIANGDCSSLENSYKNSGEDCPAVIGETREGCRDLRGTESYNYFWDGARWSEAKNPAWNILS